MCSINVGIVNRGIMLRAARSVVAACMVVGALLSVMTLVEVVIRIVAVARGTPTYPIHDEELS